MDPVANRQLGPGAVPPPQGSFELKLTGPVVTFIAGAIVALMGLVAARLAGGG